MTEQAGAVVVAGGASRRFGSATPKQFVRLGDVPLVVHAVRAFLQATSISRIALVLPEDGFERAKNLVSPHLPEGAISLVPGGASRQDSVWAGLEALRPAEAELTAVHDGARPLVGVELVDRVVAAAAEFGGAIAAVPVVETIKRVSADGTVERTVPRERLYRAQTPQCFRFRLLRDAFERARREGFEATDEAALVERTDATIRVVAGSERNLKVTSPGDLALVRLFLEGGPA